MPPVVVGGGKELKAMRGKTEAREGSWREVREDMVENCTGGGWLSNHPTIKTRGCECRGAYLRGGESRGDGASVLLLSLLLLLAASC